MAIIQSEKKRIRLDMPSLDLVKAYLYGDSKTGLCYFTKGVLLHTSIKVQQDMIRSLQKRKIKVYLRKRHLA